MCLPTCPTYQETGHERNSPRGRIALSRAVADGTLEVTPAFAEEMDYCVGCLACQTACPAGVDYAHLLETARAEVVRSGVNRSTKGTFYRWLVLRQLFTRPWLLRLVGRMLAVYQRPVVRGTIRRLGLLRLAPKHLRELEPKSPLMSPPFSFARIRATEKPTASPSYRVGLLTGCVQDVAFAGINRATADVLLAAGCEVVTPRTQGCCGSLHAHNGDLETSRQLAKANLAVFEVESLDAIISNAGGCGSHLRHYERLLADDADAKSPAILLNAKQWDAKLRDVHEWLNEIGLPEMPATPNGFGRVAYDESCHLLHGQGVSRQPRELLAKLPNTTIVPLAESDWCCGSAGIYSITQPETAGRLLERKLDHLEAAKPDVIATANPGCILQLLQGAATRPTLAGVRVVHPIELLAEVYKAATTEDSNG